MLSKAIVKIAVIAFLLVGSMSLAADGGNFGGDEGISTDTGPQVITYALPYQFAEYSYFYSDSFASVQWIQAVYSGLYKRNTTSNGRLTEDLALAPPTVSPDGLTWTVDLRPGLRFSNGHFLTADDVVFSYKVLLTASINFNTYGRYAQFLTNSSVTKIDTDTVQFVVSTKYAFTQSLLTGPIIDQEIFEPRYNDCASGNSAACNWNAADGSDAQGAAGPFYLHSISNNEVRVKKNYHYWAKDSVWAAEIKFKFIPMKSNAINELVNGDVDIVDANYALQPGELAAYPQAIEYVSTRLAHQEFALNHQHPFFGNGSLIPGNGGTVDANSLEDARLVRNAMSLAFNRTYIVQNIMGNLGDEAATAVSPSTPGYDPSVMPDAQNITLARQLMQQAGFDYTNLNYDIGNDVYTTSFFNITILSPNTSPQRNDWTNYFAQQLPSIGIGVEQLVSTGWANIIPRTFGWTGGTIVPLYDTGGFDVFAVGYSWGLDFNPGDLYTNSGLCTVGNCNNFYNYINATVENKIHQYLDEYNPASRDVILSELQEMLAYEKPVLPIIHQNEIWGIRDDVMGFDLRLMGEAKHDWSNLYKVGWGGPALPDTIPPDQVTGLGVGLITQTSVDLFWNDGTDNVIVESYNIFQDGVLVETTTGTSVLVSGLSPAVTYQFEVSAIDADGNEGPRSAPFSVTTNGVADIIAPSQVNNLISIQVDGDVSLSWNAASDNIGVVLYNVYRDGFLIGNTTDTMFVDYDVTPGISYEYSVSAVDAAGNEGTQSFGSNIFVPDNNPPSQVTGMVPNLISENIVEIAWDASSDDAGVAYYNVYRDGVFLSSVNGTSFSDDGLAAGTTYSYTVSATDINGNEGEQSTPLVVTTDAIVEFDPEILNVDIDPEKPVVGESVTITVELDNNTGISQIYVSYALDGGELFNITAVLTDEDKWQAILPNFASTGEVVFQITIIDNSGTVFVSETYDFTISEEEDTDTGVSPDLFTPTPTWIMIIGLASVVTIARYRNKSN